MKEQAKTIRVRVLRPFFMSRDRIAIVGEELELDTAIGQAVVHAGKGERLTEAHVAVPIIAAPAPAEDFRKPDAEKRAPAPAKTTQRKSK